MKWKTGDVVELMSGSPPMTVTEFGQTRPGGPNLCQCEWFDGTVASKAKFPAEALQKYEPKTPSDEDM